MSFEEPLTIQKQFKEFKKFKNRWSLCENVIHDTGEDCKNT